MTATGQAGDVGARRAAADSDGWDVPPDPVRLVDAAQAIRRWLRTGGPQHPDGAFCGWRDLDTGLLSSPYPEITGYALGFLAPSLAGESHPAEAEAGSAASRWLTDRIAAGDLSARPQLSGSAIYAFDLGMVAHGLIRYGKAAASVAVVAAGARVVEVLLDQVAGGRPLPCVLPGTADRPLRAAWSTIGRPHLLKVVQALSDGAELGLDGAEAAAGALIRDALADPAVPMTTGPTPRVVWLHPLCYAAEGLWVWGSRSGDRSALKLSRRLTEWVWQQRLPGGGFSPWAYASGGAVPGPRQSDVLAQAVRLALLHHVHEAEAAAAAAGLVRDAWRGDGQLAVYYQPDGEQRHLNCWTSLFAAQALELAGRPGGGLHWTELT